MKKIKLTNSHYQYLEKAFAEWLDVLGYCGMSVYNMPSIIREFLHFLDTKGVRQLSSFGGAGGGLTQQHIKDYHQHISTRTNQRRGGGLSANYINKHIQAIEKFLEFLSHKGSSNVPVMSVRLLKQQRPEITILTPEEIKELFAVCNNPELYLATNENNLRNNGWYEIMQSRDKAMLTVFYSCGLRRNEGVHLSIDDINFDARLLHVRRGKKYKERFVPLNKTNAAYLQEWIYDFRPQFIKTKTEHRLFIGSRGEQLSGGTLYHRLKILQEMTENIELKQKNIGLHTLRHSIATHLLQAGMSLEKIARFLGHDSLESTQIYTHLIEKTA